MDVQVVSIGFWLMMMLCIETSLSVNIRSKSSLQCLNCKLKNQRSAIKPIHSEFQPAFQVSTNGLESRHTIQRIQANSSSTLKFINWAQQKADKLSTMLRVISTAKECLHKLTP